MANRSMYVLTATGAETTAPTACAPCAPAENAGRYICLERPRFYAGQLLNDQDLTALTTWTAAKVRMARFSAGWGVVSGLQVTAAAQTQYPGWVIVKTGFAHSCCGNDLVVCDDQWVDLNAHCKKQASGCLDPSGNAKVAGAQQQTTDTTPIALCGENLVPSDLFTVDLYLQYQEKIDNFQTSLVRNHNTAGWCEASRVHESFQIVPKLVTSANAEQLSFERWAAAYAAWTEKVLMKVSAKGDEKGDEKQLCYLMQHYHTAPVHMDCHPCADETDIRLARVWLGFVKLTGPPGKSQRQCQVLAVDSYPPFRRPLGVDPLPAPEGQVNLAHLLWQRWDRNEFAIRRQLHELGFIGISKVNVESATEALSKIKTYKDARGLGNILCLPHDSVDCHLVVVNLGTALGKRIIGFSHTASDMASLTEQKSDSPPAEAAPSAGKLPHDGSELNQHQQSTQTVHL